MDIIFNCPKCGQELEVDASGAGEEITCPQCTQKIRIPLADGATVSANGPGETTPRWGVAAVNPIASSAAAKVEKHLKVPVNAAPSASLITKAAVPLEVAAKTTDRQLRIKTIRHTDCVEVGHDKFDDVVSKFLAKIGDQNLVSINAINYSHIDIASQKLLADYGVLIVYRD